MKIKHLVFAFLLLLNTYFPQDENKIIQGLFSPSFEIIQLSVDLLSIGVDAVWFASEVMTVATTTGTVTQSSLNLEQWNYSSSPNDKLIVIWANGDRLEYSFNQIDGYTDGDEEDFKKSHLMDFNVFKAGEIALHIISSTGPVEGIIEWQRNIVGNVLHENEIMNFDITNNGKYQSEIGSGFGIYQYWDEAFGSAQSNTLSYVIDEAYWKTMVHNSNTALFVLNTEIKNNSSVTTNDATYTFQNAHVFWAAYTQFADSANVGAYNMVIDAHQWIAEGTLLKNQQVYGSLQFDSDPVNNTYGPTLICKLNSGNEILLHNLINPFVTDISYTFQTEDEYELYQNYPNPFNPNTTIKYSVTVETFIRLDVFDVLGREIAVLVNEKQKPGNYRLEFDGSDLTSGIYFYRLQIFPTKDGTRDFVETRRMVLLK